MEDEGGSDGIRESWSEGEMEIERDGGRERWRDRRREGWREERWGEGEIEGGKSDYLDFFVLYTCIF